MSRPTRTIGPIGATRPILSVMLFAAAMFVLGSETAAGQPTPDEPSTATNVSNPLRFPASKPAPRRQPVDDTRFAASPAVAVELDEERDAGPDSGPAIADPSETVQAPPTAAEMIGPLARPVVVLYGDSLAWEARHVFEQALADHPVEVVTRTFGGTAICDWQDEMATDAATLQPGLVIIEFVGNNFTPCMQDSAGEALVGAALVHRYSADAAAAIATFASIDAQIVFAGAPIPRPSTATPDLNRAPLNTVYQELGERLDGVHYVDAGSSVLDNSEWTDTLPCLPVEPCPDSGATVNSVRAPDGLHFCPASAEADRGVTGDCPVWSSGAFRYGNAVAQPVLESLAAITDHT